MSVEEAALAQQLSTPRASTGTFNLPCGYLNPKTNELWTEVEVREIKGREEDMLASDEMLADAKLEALLASCTSRIGPITDRGQIAALIPDLMGGDRIFLLFAIRRVTLGNIMHVREQCPQCKTKSLFTVDLRELSIKQMPNPMKRIYDVTTPSGLPVRFRASTGQDEKRVTKVMKKDRQDAISLMMMQRIELLDGKAPDLAMLKDLGMGDRQWLREQFQSVEGGVDTSLDLDCPKCGAEWSKEFNVAAQSFFSRSGTSKR